MLVHMKKIYIYLSFTLSNSYFTNIWEGYFNGILKDYIYIYISIRDFSFVFNGIGSLGPFCAQKLNLYLVKF